MNRGFVPLLEALFFHWELSYPHCIGLGDNFTKDESRKVYRNVGNTITFKKYKIPSNIIQICSSNSGLFLICVWLSNDDVCDVSIMNSLFFSILHESQQRHSCIHCQHLKTITSLFRSKFPLKSKVQPTSVSAHKPTLCYGFFRTYILCISRQACQCFEWQQGLSPTTPSMVHTTPIFAVDVWTIPCIDSISCHARHS